MSVIESNPLLARRTRQNPGAEDSSHHAAERRVRTLMAVGLALVGVLCLAARLLYPFDFLPGTIGWLLGAAISRFERLVSSWTLLEMGIYPGALLGIFALERLYPAVPEQRTLSTGLVHDALWLILEAMLVVVFVGWYGRLLFSVYDRHLSFLTFPVAQAWPTWLRLGIGVLVLDLARWVQHWLHHKVRWLWPFHAVHHAQRELNLFSDHRIHFMEHLVRRPVTVLPLLMLGLQAPEVTGWLLLLSWHSRLYHANIRSNFGPLRYILVTPQSHRLHHSRRPEHFDHNYGAMLSIWDYLFGTQYPDCAVYPPTGIPDETFPVESAGSVGGMLLSPIRQMLYPFRCLWGMLCNRLQR